MREMSKNGWANEALAALTQSKVNCLLRAHRGKMTRSLPSPTLFLSNTHSLSLSVCSEWMSEGECAWPWVTSEAQRGSCCLQASLNCICKTNPSKINPSRYSDRYLQYPAFLQWPHVLSAPVMKHFIEMCTSTLTPQWNGTVICLSSQRYDLQYEGSASSTRRRWQGREWKNKRA